MCKQPQFVLLVSRKIPKTISFDFVAPNSNFTDSAESLLAKNQHTIIPRKRSNVMIIKCLWWATRGLWKGDFDICGDLRRFTASNCRVDGTASLWPHLATVCGRKVLTVLPFYGPIRTGMHSVVNNVLRRQKKSNPPTQFAESDDFERLYLDDYSRFFKSEKWIRFVISSSF